MADHVPAATANSVLIILTKAVGGSSLDHGMRVVGTNPGDMESALRGQVMRAFKGKPC